MVFQSFNLLPHMMVLDNVVEAPVGVLKTGKLAATEEAGRLLERVGLGEAPTHARFSRSRAVTGRPTSR